MKNVLTVMRKEFARFFGDRRMVIMILLPAILIYVVYSFMGRAMQSMFTPDENYIPQIYAVNMPEQILQLTQSAGIETLDIGADMVTDIQDKISQGEADLCVIFPAGFMEQVAVYDARTGAPAPDVEIYYNSTVPNSSDVYGRINALLDYFEVEKLYTNKFDVNRGVENADLATSKDLSASIISSLMPLLLMIFLYSGCIGLAPESIAGEKERGTLATLLVTPLKRSELAIGKILSLGVLSFLSGLVTAGATILSLPKLMGGAEEMIDVNIYGAVDYVLLAFVILSTILLLVAVISILSAFAKTVKEANTIVIPLMILVMLVGVTGMFGGGTQTSAAYYFIPLYSSVQSMSGVFSLNYSVLNIVFSSLSNVVYACIGGFVLTKMFNNEKVMFSR